ncbi:MAG: radical SAM protein [Deltaproteobacteria bacterium]|nr:radical SAM protein [Deltaproteobacteria bacterium]
MQKPRGYDKIVTTLKHYTYPPVVIIETINKCNLSCVMCPQGQLTRPIGSMPEYLYRKIIDDIALYSPDQTQLWLAIMGEVLLLKDRALDYIKYAVERGLSQVNLNTNLAAVDEKFCVELVKTGVHKIIVGLDAATSETYAKIRRGGDFNRVMANIEAILKTKAELNSKHPELILQFIEQDDNRHEMELFKETFRHKPVTLKLRQRLGWGTGVEAANLDLPPESRTFPCPWLTRTMSIHVTGQVAQCDAAWNGQYYYGDLNFQSIAEVWNGHLAEIRRRHWMGNFDFEPCRSCRDWQCGLSEWIYYRDDKAPELVNDICQAG